MISPYLPCLMCNRDIALETNCDMKLYEEHLKKVHEVWSNISWIIDETLMKIKTSKGASPFIKQRAEVKIEDVSSSEAILDLNEIQVLSSHKENSGFEIEGRSSVLREPEDSIMKELVKKRKTSKQKFTNKFSHVLALEVKDMIISESDKVIPVVTISDSSFDQEDEGNSKFQKNDLVKQKEDLENVFTFSDINENKPRSGTVSPCTYPEIFLYMCSIPGCDFQTDKKGMQNGESDTHMFQVHCMNKTQIKEQGYKWNKISLENRMEQIFAED